MVKNTPLSSRSKSYNNGTRYASIYISHNGSQLIIVWWLKKNISPKYVCFMRARIISVWRPEPTVVRARGKHPGHLLNGRIDQIAKACFHLLWESKILTFQNISSQTRWAWAPCLTYRTGLAQYVGHGGLSIHPRTSKFYFHFNKKRIHWYPGSSG